ncbi:MAG TPA: pseudouridine synthase [Treponemataceae bacterium]|nr:pseudouridine synthase [Treponemataceae bacterium]
MKSRLDKLLSANGFGSRKEIKRLLKDRVVAVNGVRRVDPSTDVDPELDAITLDGEPLRILTTVYLMLNKPAGVISSTEDPDHRTVIDVLGEPWASMDLFPIGRLDVDTEGLLVITNDGPLTHRLTSPKTGVDKTYYARLRDPVDDAALASYREAFRAGVPFRDGHVCLPAKIDRCGDEADGVIVTIQEGKYHQVKKMFYVVGNEVAYLKRESMGNLSLDPALKPGEFRELTSDELALLRGE